MKWNTYSIINVSLSMVLILHVTDGLFYNGT